LFSQITPSHPHGSRLLKILAFGIIILLLEYISIDTPGDQFYEATGIRAGWLTITQLHLLIILSGKAGLIGLFTRIRYKRIDVLH
jgi:ferric-chelate reductase